MGVARGIVQDTLCAIRHTGFTLLYLEGLSPSELTRQHALSVNVMSGIEPVDCITLPSLTASPI